jgi:uncharacterized protein (DUF58 family)
MANEPIVDKAFLERLERLTLRWRRSFPGTIGGHHVARLSGVGQEFLDHRQFHHGDDLRSVNWRAYMRLDKLFLKVFHMEPHIPIRVLIDVSASMATGNPSKFHYLQTLVAALSYVGVLRLETITLLPFSDKLHEDFVVGGGRHRFAPAVEFLSALRPEGASRASAAIKQFADRYLQRGLLIVVSDFFDEENVLPLWQSLSMLGHELFLIHLYAEEDRTPPWKGLLEIEDAETGRVREIQFDDSARAEYERAFDEYARQLERMALRNDGRYAAVSTGTPLDQVLFETLSRLQEAPI